MLAQPLPITTPEDVGFSCQDYGGARGYGVGNVAVGEWLKYSITNSEAGTYQFKIRARLMVEDAYGTSFNLSMESPSMTNTTSSYVLNTTNWSDIYLSMSVPVGSQKLRLNIGSVYSGSPWALFDYITVYKMPPLVSNGGKTMLMTNLSQGYNLQTALSNAAQMQTAVSSLTNGGVVTIPAGTYYFCQAFPIENGPSSMGSIRLPLVSSVTGGTVMAGDNRQVGMQFTVGNLPLTVTDLGRWVVGGNTGMHNVSIIDVVSNTMVASASVPTFATGSNAFSYVALNGNATLRANTTYAIVSEEQLGGDAWLSCETNNVVVHNVVGSLCRRGSGLFSPVSFLYKAAPSTAVQNYAVWVNNNNITIQGQGTNAAGGTTLAAYNRDTTLLFFGGNGSVAPNGAQAVTNILVRNLQFKGNPMVDFTGATNSWGIVNEDGGIANIGSLMTFGGKLVTGTITY
jgi:hypothetical protein